MVLSQLSYCPEPVSDPASSRAERLQDRTPSGAELLLQCLLSGFAVDTERRHRASLQPLDADLFFALFAETVAPIVDPLQRLVDLRQQLSLAIADAEHEVAVELEGSAVGGIGKVLLVVGHAVDGAARLSQKLHTALTQELLEELEVSLVLDL